MRHHLCLSGLSRPENRRKTSHVYDVEVCIVVQQDLCCMRLGCSRLLHRWGTPHQCFLHQLYKICLLQLWSKHWTSAHKQSMYNYVLHNAKTGTTTVKKTIQLQLFLASFLQDTWPLLAEKKIGLCKPVSKWSTLHPCFKRNSHLGVRENSTGFCNERTFVFFDEFRGWLVSLIVGTVQSISKSWRMEWEWLSTKMQQTMCQQCASCSFSQSANNGHFDQIWQFDNWCQKILAAGTQTVPVNPMTKRWNGNPSPNSKKKFNDYQTRYPQNISGKSQLAVPKLCGVKQRCLAVAVDFLRIQPMLLHEQLSDLAAMGWGLVDWKIWMLRNSHLSTQQNHGIPKQSKNISWFFYLFSMLFTSFEWRWMTKNIN